MIFERDCFMEPYLLQAKYPTGGLSVIAADVADADPCAENGAGTADAAPAIQAAVDACAALGGGTVYLPEGRYALRTPLTMKTAVTLRGEWIDPEAEPNAGRGTILCCYVGRGDPEGIPQVTMQACSGFKNITFFYPEQSVDDPEPYSPTVHQPGGDSVNLENVTMIAVWRGVQCGPKGNELHTLKNVYISPVDMGMFMDVTTDIGRLQNLNISPRYWEGFTLTPENKPLSPEQCKALRVYMLAHTTGVFMARSDWEYGYGIRIENCHIGFTITSFSGGGPNAQFCRLQLHNCYIGFHLITVNAYGVALSDSRITADLPGLKAAVVSDSRFETVMQLNGVELSGCYPHMVIHEGNGELSFVNCKLSGWTETAVLQKRGGLSMLQCAFGKGHHFTLEDGIGGAQILGCTFEGDNGEKGCGWQAGEEAQKKALLSFDPLHLPAAPAHGHKFRSPVGPSSALLYNAADYGARPIAPEQDIYTAPDNTAAIEAALKAAGETGGIVYLPAGWYRCDGSLHVPSGVELRGVFEQPCHTCGGGTVLMPFRGKGDENAPAFITLAESAGVRGLVIEHPEQDASAVMAYPWAVQGQGKNVYALDVVFVNAWQGLDFGTYPCKGHYASYISGAPIHCGIYVDRCGGEGWVENVQYNPHYYSRSNFPNRPQRGGFRDFSQNQITYLDALKFGYTENEHLLGTFVYAAKHGLYFVLGENGKGAKGTFIGHGTDGGETGLCIAGCEDIDLINTELVVISSPRTRIYFKTEEGSTGTARVYNTLMWGAPHLAVVLDGGCETQFQQTNIVDPGRMAVTVRNGKHTFAATYFYRNTGNFTVEGGELTAVGSMTPRRPTTVLENFTTGGVLNELYTWDK